MDLSCFFFYGDPALNLLLHPDFGHKEVPVGMDAVALLNGYLYVRWGVFLRVFSLLGGLGNGTSIRGLTLDLFRVRDAWCVDIEVVSSGCGEQNGAAGALCDGNLAAGEDAEEVVGTAGRGTGIGSPVTRESRESTHTWATGGLPSYLSSAYLLEAGTKRARCRQRRWRHESCGGRSRRRELGGGGGFGGRSGDGVRGDVGRALCRGQVRVAVLKIRRRRRRRRHVGTVEKETGAYGGYGGTNRQFCSEARCGEVQSRREVG